jgi:hypothetical protein
MCKISKSSTNHPNGLYQTSKSLNQRQNQPFSSVSSSSEEKTEKIIDKNPTTKSQSAKSFPSSERSSLHIRRQKISYHVFFVSTIKNAF